MGVGIFIIVLVVVMFFVLFSFVIKFNKKTNYNNQVNNQTTYADNLVINGISENALSVIFAVEDVFIVEDKFIVTGVVVKGSIKSGDVLYYLGNDSSIKSATIIGLEAFKNTVEVANSGDKVGLMVDATGTIDKNTYLYRQN